MKFVVFSLILVLTTALAYSQDTSKTIETEIRLNVNTRNAKIDTAFDYYIGIGSKIVVKGVITIDLKGSYERDNGTIYSSHSEKVSYKYGQVGYIYDTEKDVKLFYTSIYYPFLKIFKVGYDFSIDQKINHSIYLGVKWQFIEIEITFLDEVRRIKYLINPVIKKWNRLSLNANIEGFYIKSKFKWQNGVMLNYKIS